MKKVFNFFVFATMIVAMTISSCSEEENDEEQTTPVQEIEFKDVFMNADPSGEITLSTDLLTIDGAWTLSGDKALYSWIEPIETTGTGNAVFSFSITSNKTSGARTATFKVREKTTLVYKITISQDALGGFEYNVNATDLAFLQAIVSGKLLGDDTPYVEDWKEVPEDDFPGITLAKPSGATQLFVVKIDGAPLTDFPATVNLPELREINLRGIASLTGKKLPTDWNTPKCYSITLAFTGLTGPIPQGIASDPELYELYLDGCNFYGALPHIWVSKNLQILILNSGNERLGYMVPATFDVILNKYAGTALVNECNDKTQMKFDDRSAANWVGYEKGWGQVRYEKYDSGAAVGDLTTWSSHRLLEDDWAWYFSNLGMVPKVLSDWNPAAAAAYTASCER
jgi:hypothetical protein